MDLTKLVSDLKKEEERLRRAIVALLGSASSALSPGGKKRGGRPKGGATKGKKRKRGELTPAGRRRLSLAMKKRWREGKMKRK